MSQVVKFYPVLEVPRRAADAGAARRLLRAVLLRAAQRAAHLAARLEAAEVPVGARVLDAAPVRPWAPAGGARRVEVVVVVAVAVYFVAGLVGVFVA